MQSELTWGSTKLSKRCRWLALAIHFSPIADVQGKNHEFGIADIAYYPPVSDTILPETSETRTGQRLANAARIIQRTYARFQELHDPVFYLRVLLAKHFIGLCRKPNLPSHDAL